VFAHDVEVNPNRDIRKSIKDASRAEGTSFVTRVLHEPPRALVAPPAEPTSVMHSGKQLRKLAVRLEIVEKRPERRCHKNVM
jgi:hypothetical protein